MEKVVFYVYRDEGYEVKLPGYSHVVQYVWRECLSVEQKRKIMFGHLSSRTDLQGHQSRTGGGARRTPK